MSLGENSGIDSVLIDAGRLSYTEDIDKELKLASQEIGRELFINNLISYVTAPFRSFYNWYQK